MYKDPISITKDIFKMIGTSRSDEMAHKIIGNDYSLLDRFIKSQYGNNKDLAGGACARKKYVINYNKMKFNFYCFDDECVSEYVLTSKTNDKCAVVFVGHKSKIAYIQNINNVMGCIKDGLVYSHGGTTLLKAVFSLMIALQKDIGITRIQLKDNSQKFCYNSNGKVYNPIRLPEMSFLLNGDTWYGKYGFRPYDDITNELDENLNNEYLKNKKIISKARVKDVAIYKYIIDASKKLDIKVNLPNIKKFIEKKADQSLSSFLKDFLKNYDHMCGLFSGIYLQIYKELKMYSFYNLSFYLDLPTPKQVLKLNS